MSPSEKHINITNFLEALVGRSTSITTNKCIEPPYGCGGPATEFKNNASESEYRISGLCQKCQDKIFK